MSLDRINEVDAIGIDRASGTAVLTIVDSWNWLEEHTHLVALQEKIEAYFAFIESGDVFVLYPKAVNRKLAIEIVTRYPLTEAAKSLLLRAAESANELHVEITTHQAEGSK